VMVGGRLRTVRELLEPYDDSATRREQRALVGAEAAPAGAAWRLGDHAHDPRYWWHEPEWLHRVCCES